MHCIHALQKANINHTGCVPESCGALEYEKDSKCETDKVAIAGIICGVIGGVLVITIVVGGLVYYYKRKNNRNYAPLSLNP